MTLRESDVRPADLLAEYLRLNAEDGRRLLAASGELQERPCPGCGGTIARRAFAKNGFTLVRCEDCDSLYVNPVPTANGLAAFYRNSPSADYWANVFFPAVAEPRRQAIYRPRAERIARIASANRVVVRHVVDVGAGAGLLLEEFSRLHPAADIRAVEPGAAHASALRDKSIETFEGFAGAAALDPAWTASADVVTCFEVLEHVTKPTALLSDLAALARPGGLVVVSGLSGSGFDIRVLGERSKPVSPPHHLTFLSVAGAEAAIGRCGLESLGVTTPGELDVDIVRNAALENPAWVEDPTIRRLVLEANDEERRRFQDTLKESRRSSHMWIVARRPEGSAARS